ncbi:hypothetical protein AcW1_002999 [Taiwanofungus camphoratus]|nr:hypothetical protein AcW1_002999 [Antrodia cinnamomea]
MSQRTQPPFPIEIVEYILEKLTAEELSPVLRANSLLYAIAVRVLYRNVSDLPIRRTVPCLRTLGSGTTSATLVHNLNIDWTYCTPTGNLFRLLNCALQQLTALRHLSLEFSPHENQFSLAWLFDGCTFRLRTLATSIRCDFALAQFLETQPRIQELCLRGFQTNSPFILTPSALPELTSFRAVHAGAPVLSQVLRGRPVEGVSLSLFSEDGLAPLDTLTLSSRPIKRLTVMSLDHTSPCALLDEVAMRTPGLEALHIVILVAQFDRVRQFSSN